jgi:hypothetical protein
MIALWFLLAVIAYCIYSLKTVFCGLLEAFEHTDDEEES